MKLRIKTIIFSAFAGIALLSTFSASAQFSVGARAGANLATEPAEGLYHVFLARPYIGIFGQYNVSSPFAVQVGVNYSGEGANYKDLGTNDTYQIRHSFLTIPVLAQYKFAFGGYIEAGPQFGFLLSAKERANDDAFAGSKQYYKGTDFGAGVGLGYEVKNGSVKGLGINVRYMRGISAINKYPLESGDDIKTRVLSIGLTYRLEK